METYKGFTIEADRDVPGRLVCYPTEEGIQHDYDYTGDGYRYCGNCVWADSIEGAKAEIDDLLARREQAEKELEAFKLWLEYEPRPKLNRENLRRLFKREYAGYYENGLRGYADAIAEANGWYAEMAANGVPRDNFNMGELISDLIWRGVYEIDGHVFEPRTL